MGEDKWQVLNAASEKHSRAKNKAIDGQQSRIVVRYEERGTLWDPLQSSHIGSVVRDDNVLDEVGQPLDTPHVPLIEPIGVVEEQARISSGDYSTAVLRKLTAIVLGAKLSGRF